MAYAYVDDDAVSYTLRHLLTVRRTDNAAARDDGPKATS